MEVQAPKDKVQRSEVVRRRIAFEAEPARYAASYATQQTEFRNQVVNAQSLFADVVLADDILDLISHLCCEFEVASLRADIVMHKVARALAALDGRTTVNLADVKNAAEFVLPHRRRRKPFEQPGLDKERLDELMNEAAEHQNAASENETPPNKQQAELQAPAEQCDENQADENQAQSEQESAKQPANEQIASAALTNPSPKISVALSANSHSSAGRRSQVSEVARGRVLRTVPHENPDSLAIAATLKSAAMRDAAEFSVKRSDLHQNIRTGKTANLILFVVDASGSMAAQQRMEAVKGAVLSLLTDAYQQRDEVAVISFRGEQASILLTPTRSVEQAELALRELPTGGRTPLSHALQLALDMLEKTDTRHAPPLLIVLSDGKANVALQENGDPWRETLALADLIAERTIPALVLDTETGYLRLGRANQLSQAMGAEYLTLEALSAENLALTISARIGRV